MELSRSILAVTVLSANSAMHHDDSADHPLPKRTGVELVQFVRIEYEWIEANAAILWQIEALKSDPQFAETVDVQWRPSRVGNETRQLARVAGQADGDLIISSLDAVGFGESRRSLINRFDRVVLGSASKPILLLPRALSGSPRANRAAGNMQVSSAGPRCSNRRLPCRVRRTSSIFEVYIRHGPAVLVFGIAGRRHIITGGFVYFNPKRLRRPEERVGTLANAALPPPSTDAITDADHALVRSLRARDERAFEKLIQRYSLPLLRLAIGFVRSRDEADEVVQETWLAVLSGIDRFEARSSFKTWLFRILKNRARSRAQREARTLPFSVLAVSDSASADADVFLHKLDAAAPLWAGAPSRSGTPEDHVLAVELRGRIDAAVAGLPGNQQEVLTLRDVEGWSAAEVCEALELSDANQRVLLHRARGNVRAALSAYVQTGLSERDSQRACA